MIPWWEEARISCIKWATNNNLGLTIMARKETCVSCWVLSYAPRTEGGTFPPPRTYSYFDRGRMGDDAENHKINTMTWAWILDNIRRDRGGGRNPLLTQFLFILRGVRQLVVSLGLVTLVPVLVMILRILVMIVWRTESHSMVITASEHSSSQTPRRVTQQMGDEVTLIKQK